MENVVFLFFRRVFSAQGVCHLHLGVVEHLLLKVAYLALFVARGPFDWAQRAVVFVVRADGHVVEAAVRNARQAHLVQRVGYVYLRRARVQTLVDKALSCRLLHVESPAIFHGGRRLYRFLRTDAVSIVASFLELLRLLEVAQLVVGD